MAISVIITTYQRPRALDLVLSSLANQRKHPLEIIIADDGSSKETQDIVDNWTAQSKVPIIHCWQEDLGFRAAEIRNKAALKASGDYLVFLDGDCLVFPDFIERHTQLAEKNHMVIGSRILCSKSFTKMIEAGLSNPLVWNYFDWLKAKCKKKINRIYPLFRLPDLGIRKLRAKRWQGVRTFNLAIWAQDFHAVNGFDQRFQGWGHEDADLAIRLINNNNKRKDGQFSIPVLHLWHKENDRTQVESNIELLNESINRKLVFAKIGLSKNKLFKNQSKA